MAEYSCQQTAAETTEKHVHLYHLEHYVLRFNFPYVNSGHTMRHVSVPSPFHLRFLRMVSVHTVRRVQSPSGTAHDRKPAIISIKYAAHCHGMRFPFIC